MNLDLISLLTNIESLEENAIYVENWRNLLLENCGSSSWEDCDNLKKWIIDIDGGRAFFKSTEHLRELQKKKECVQELYIGPKGDVQYIKVQVYKLFGHELYWNTVVEICGEIDYSDCHCYFGSQYLARRQMKGFGVEKRPAVCPHCSSTDYCKHAIACFDVREGSLLFAAAEAEYGKFIKALYLKCESLHQGDENKNRFHSDFYFIWRFFQKQDASVESSMENRNEVEKYEAEIYLRALRDLGCHKSDEINSSGGSNIVSVTAYSNDSERVYSKSIEWLEDNLLFKGGGAGAPSSEGGSFEHWIVLFSNSITLAVQW